MFTIPLSRSLFGLGQTTLLAGEGFRVTGRRYPTGIESVTVANERGSVEVLPWLGQMVWDVTFDGTSMTMASMFSQPRPAEVIVDTYGCFAFHSGLLANGCPSPEDDHPLHGEFACADLDEAWLEVSEGQVAVRGRFTWVKGFGHHYDARPAVVLASGDTHIDIDLEVTNLSKYQPMPLQYMCHMNHAWVEGALMVQSVGDVFQLRETIPAHVRPTPEWSAFMADLADGTAEADVLLDGSRFDPEVVWFTDDLRGTGEVAHFELQRPDGRRHVVEFSPEQFPIVTRWLLNNPDQQVCAFALPGTSRPEGYLAARAAGTLVELAPGATRSFHVRTGLEG